ncbi:uncharacterized protein LOC129755435 [Uranotaenia lowii]|uniref:uncharacterized protein LOC129755435 n=1 Tax=Uranotaenia lowii TaxID=190385 RepID=UPI002478B39C|nr:uncharacterized protein LOC129755435 [Uranotaenia lowii]
MSGHISDRGTNGSGNGSNDSNRNNKRLRLSQSRTGSESATVDRGAPAMAAGSSSNLQEIDLAGWQKTQIAVCTLENTVNIVVENYHRFLEAHQLADNRGGDAEEQDRLQYLWNLDARTAEMETDQEVLVEDQAILAAISEQGLQPARAIAVAGDPSSSGSMAGLLPIDGSTRRIDDFNPEVELVPEALNNHTGIDFLETAVAAAIQEKGLTSAGGQFYQGDMEDDDGR